MDSEPRYSIVIEDDDEKKPDYICMISLTLSEAEDYLTRYGDDNTYMVLESDL